MLRDEEVHLLACSALRRAKAWKGSAAQVCFVATGAAAVLVALRAVFARHDLHACTLRCFDLVTRLRTTGCYALSRLNDQGLIAGCEGDVPSTLTMRP